MSSGSVHAEGRHEEGRRGPRVLFVGAGPGAGDLLTFRGADAIASADLVVWAASLVAEEVLHHARPDAEIVDSSRLTLEEVLSHIERVTAAGGVVARLQSGDPSLYGAIQEQIAFCERRGLPWEIVPGVSSLGAAAAVAGRELTVPEVAQTLICTRLAGRTPMPQGEDLRELARHGTTLALFLSAARPARLVSELLAGGYPPDTPSIVVYRASWPDELVIRCRLDELAARLRGSRITKTALIFVGPGLEAHGTRSRLYAPGFIHGYRRPARDTAANDA